MNYTASWTRIRTSTLCLHMIRSLGYLGCNTSMTLSRLSQTCIGIRDEAVALFGLQEGEILPDLRISEVAVQRKQWGHHFEQPIDQTARAADPQRVPDDVISIYFDEQDQDSDDDDSDTASDSSTVLGFEEDSEEEKPLPLEEDIEDFEQMKLAYQVDDGMLVGGFETLNSLELVPRSWPLAKLTFPLQKMISSLDRLMAGCCWEALASRVNHRQCLPSIRLTAKSVTLSLASYLAQEVASLFRTVKEHPIMTMYDDETLHLLCANYWVRPIYQELLQSTSSYNATKTGEEKRPCSGLVKVIAHQKPVTTQQGRAHTSPFTDWIGGMCPADTLLVWFPAHSMPIITK